MSRAQEVTGIVNNAGNKKVGKNLYYNFTLVDDDTLYRCGKEDPVLVQGDEIVFEFTDGDYGPMVDLSTIEVLSEGNDIPKSKPKARKPARASRGRSAAEATSKRRPARATADTTADKKATKDDYWNQKAEDDKARQKQISFQAAYNTALAILTQEIALGLVKLGTDKASAPKKLAAFEALLQEKVEMLWAQFNDAATRTPGGTSLPSDDDVDADDVDDQVDDNDEEDDDFDD